MDPQVVTTELVEFWNAYRAVQDIVPVNDLISGDKDLQELHLDDVDCSTSGPVLLKKISNCPLNNGLNAAMLSHCVCYGNFLFIQRSQAGIKS